MIRIFGNAVPFLKKHWSEKTLSNATKLSLEEARVFCSSQKLIDKIDETEDQQRLRALFHESGRVSTEAFRRKEPFDGPLHQRASAMSKEADCSSLILLRSQLRSEALKPGDIDGLIVSRSLDTAVAGLVETRSRLCKAIEQPTPSSRDAGRLLLYEPYENVCDGASEYSSNGFFDVNDAPPWDTWVSFDGRTLLSWVPPVLVPLAQAGIDANAVDCIRWAG